MRARATFFLFISIFGLLYGCAHVHAQSCNPPSGWLTQDQPATLGDAAIFGPNCGQLQDSGGVPVVTSMFAPTTYNPQPACGTATFSVTNNAFFRVNKVLHINYQITITSLGTCLNGIGAALPSGSIAAFGQYIPAFRSNDDTFAVCTTGAGSGNYTCAKSGAVNFVNGDSLWISGWVFVQ